MRLYSFRQFTSRSRSACPLRYQSIHTSGILLLTPTKVAIRCEILRRSGHWLSLAWSFEFCRLFPIPKPIRNCKNFFRIETRFTHWNFLKRWNFCSSDKLKSVFDQVNTSILIEALVKMYASRILNLLRPNNTISMYTNESAVRQCWSSEV